MVNLHPPHDSSSSEWAIRLEGVGKSWPGLPSPLLRGVDLEVPPGGFLAVSGPSGSGKSTLLGILAGLSLPDVGEVWVAGRCLTALGEEDRANLRATRIGLLFQDSRLLLNLSALDNVALPLLLRGEPPQVSRDAASRLLHRVGLEPRLHSPGRVLSGGERHRVALARALVHRPQVVLGDEPTASLDPQSARSALNLLLELRQEQGLALLLATHDPLVTTAADRAVVLREGKLESG